MAIYRNLKNIPIPKEAKVSPSSKRVYVNYRSNGVRFKRELGIETSPGMMVPNDNFRIDYPHLWSQYYPKAHVPLPAILAGNYATCLSIGWSTGVYPALQECFGPFYGNAVMDFARFMLREQSSVAMTFEQCMEGQLFFAGKAMSDSWYSSLFSKELTAGMIHQFRDSWLKRCVSNGMHEVWLCIDGSNSDCAMRTSSIAEPGHAKSLKDRPIISYMWAVDPASKMPVTWFVNNGGMPDCKAIDEMIRYLTSSDLKIKGVILDRGFVSKDVLTLLEERGLDYIVMLTSNTKGYKSMVDRHGASLISEDASHLLSSEYIFGTTDKVKIFSDSQHESCVALYFSAGRKYMLGKNFLEKLFEAQDQIARQIQNNAKEVVIPSGFKPYFRLIKENGCVVDFNRNNKKVNASLLKNGFHAIASAVDRDALEIMELYRLRDYSEKQFSQLKSQLGGGVVRVHSDQAAEARFMVGFVASILRTDIMIKCQQLKISDTNKLIRDLDKAFLRLLSSGRYEAVHTYSERLEKFFALLGLEFGHFQKLADLAKLQRDGIDNTQVRESEFIAKRGRGRPKGSKNKKTLEREAAERALGQSVVNRSPGRPKGSKNRKTLEREAAERALGQPVVKRSPGRPKGSKNKKTLEREAAERALGQPIVKRTPGRPKGSKNKKTLEREAAERALGQPVVKRGPGRPKGSKNKKTLEREAAQRALCQPVVKHVPGSLKDSKDKEPLEREASAEHAQNQCEVKRSPCRTKGSKSKKTLEREAQTRAQAHGKRGRCPPGGSKNKSTSVQEGS